MSLSNADPAYSRGHKAAHTSRANNSSTVLADTVLILPTGQHGESSRQKRGRDVTDEEGPAVKKPRAEAQPFLEKITEKFRTPKTVITLPNKVTVTSEEKKRNNNKRATTEPRDSPGRTKTSKLGKESSVFRVGSAHHPLTVSDEMTPVNQSRVKSRVEEQSRDQDSHEVVILNDEPESPPQEIESRASNAFLDMTRDEEKNSEEESASRESFDLFADSQPLTASRDSKIGTLPRLALVCLQIDRLVVRDTDVKGEFVLRVKAEHLCVSAVDASSPPIEIEIAELVQVQYSALHRLLVLRLKTVPASLSTFYHHKGTCSVLAPGTVNSHTALRSTQRGTDPGRGVE